MLLSIYLGASNSIPDPQVMNAGLKIPHLTLQAGTIHQPRFLAVRCPDTGKPVSLAACLLPAGISRLDIPHFHCLQGSARRDVHAALCKMRTQPRCSPPPPAEMMNLPAPRKVAARQVGEILAAVSSHRNSSHASQVNAGEARKDACTSPSSNTQASGGGKEFGWLPFTTQRKGEQGCLPGSNRK